ncbi:HTH-type transcriptional regulator YidZ [Aeromonas dhakensis]|uniref:HTH-type transcriptional regulator YidZ n=1 Tax=Aeromonas dhakensis TaxID=196024 RepID=UPI00227AC92D|nr:HTH-type transcriptional regulator YidZ [Aeromonas dhakensis]WAF79006.1 HTH-type transcriptional regulator YidZ [Aeromonas dhakensis]
MRPLIDLDLNLLVVFRLLLQERSVTKAAKKLNVTAPTVSKALARLRDWFDDQLFLRTQRGLEPTNLSLTLEEELKEWFQLSGNIASLCGNAIPAGAAFRLVLESPFYISFLNDLPMVIYETYRKSTIRIMNWDHHSLNDIINGDADLGFCARETHPSSLARVNRLPYYIDHEVLFEDRPMVFLRKDHPLLARTWNLDNFLAYPHVSVVWEASDAWALDSLLDDEGLSRQVPIRVSSFEQALHIAAQSDHELIAVVPSYCASYARQHHDNLISLPLPLDEALYRQLDIAFILLWHKRNNHNTKVLWLRDEIKRLYHQHIGATGAG